MKYLMSNKPAQYSSSGTYEIQEADNVQIGTKIVVHLKTDCREFSDDERVKSMYI